MIVYVVIVVSSNGIELMAAWCPMVPESIQKLGIPLLKWVGRIGAWISLMHV